jgi:hypothetical protein
MDLYLQQGNSFTEEGVDAGKRETRPNKGAIALIRVAPGNLRLSFFVRSPARYRRRRRRRRRPNFAPTSNPNGPPKSKKHTTISVSFVTAKREVPSLDRTGDLRIVTSFDVAIRRTTTVLLEPLVVKAGKLKYIESKRKAQSSDSGAPCSLSFDNPNKQ